MGGNGEGSKQFGALTHGRSVRPTAAAAVNIHVSFDYNGSLNAVFVCGIGCEQLTALTDPQ